MTYACSVSPADLLAAQTYGPRNVSEHLAVIRSSALEAFEYLAMRASEHMRQQHGLTPAERIRLDASLRGDLWPSVSQRRIGDNSGIYP